MESILWPIFFREFCFVFLRELCAEEVYRGWKGSIVVSPLRAEAFLSMLYCWHLLHDCIAAMGGRAVPAGSLFLPAARVPFSAETGYHMSPEEGEWCCHLLISEPV